MKTLLQALLVFGLYISFLFFEGFLGFMEMGLTSTQASAQSSSTVVLRDVEHTNPYATYGLEGFDEIEIQFIVSNEIPSDLIHASCPGELSLVPVQVDRGVEYTLIYTPQKYCKEVTFTLHDTDLVSVSWDHWGFMLQALLDMPDDTIVARIRDLSAKIGELGSVRDGHEREYLRQISEAFARILRSRENPGYIVPVPGSTIPTNKSFIPNAGRPYRKDYTDGIHHGWDFYGAFGAPVVSLDDGVIIYIRDDFVWDDFNEIEHDLSNKSKEEMEAYKHTNLDVLRGNQIWIKTMSGDVAFYSHFNEISDDLEIGDLVTRGQKIGTIGVTGVPLKGYNKYHLHMPLMINPLSQSKIGKNSRLDIMRWDWYGKNKDDSWIFENQKNIFLYK